MKVISISLVEECNLINTHTTITEVKDEKRTTS